jgi:hypothetical protein
VPLQLFLAFTTRTKTLARVAKAPKVDFILQVSI